MAKPSKQSELNLATYEQPEIVNQWLSMKDLSEGERRVLERLRGAIDGKAILDIGVGGGRTTAALLTVSADYTGIDYSAAMVASCRQRFPGVRFSQCDVRDLSPLGTKLFDFIWFSRNGLDTLDAAERVLALSQILARLKPGGWFLFSSHNRLCRTEKPWHLNLYVYDWRSGPRAVAQSILGLVRNNLNYWRYYRFVHEAHDHAIRIDSAHNFSGVHYYTDPELEAERLARLGFASIEVMTGGGKSLPREREKQANILHPMFLARKPE